MEIYLSGQARCPSQLHPHCRGPPIKPILRRRVGGDSSPLQLSWLNQNLNSLVFLLWSSYAQKGSAAHRKRHHVLHTTHPSPSLIYKGSLDVDIFLKPTNCCTSLARSLWVGRSCEGRSGLLLGWF
jgi:hypothetical protein